MSYGIKSGRTYASRSYFLKLLGFSSYNDYLKSDLWQRIRQRVFQVKGRQCWLCGKHATQVHHNRYHRLDLIGKRLKYLSPICGSCHEGIEFLGDVKATVNEARRAFMRLSKQAKERRRRESEIKHLTDLLLNFDADNSKRQLTPLNQ